MAIDGSLASSFSVPIFYICCACVCVHECVWKPEVSPGCCHLGSVHLSYYKLLLLLCVCARTRSTAHKWRSEDNFAKSDLSFHLLMSSGDPAQAAMIAKQTPYCFTIRLLGALIFCHGPLTCPELSSSAMLARM